MLSDTSTRAESGARGLLDEREALYPRKFINPFPQRGAMPAKASPPKKQKDQHVVWRPILRLRTFSFEARPISPTQARTSRAARAYRTGCLPSMAGISDGAPAKSNNHRLD